MNGVNTYHSFLCCFESGLVYLDTSCPYWSSQVKLTEKYDIDFGKLGARLDIARTENEASVAIVEHTLAAPLHWHSHEDEISHVLEGVMTVLEDDTIMTVRAGESIVKGRHIWHTFWKAGNEPLRFLEIIASGEFSEFFEEIAPLTPSGT